MLYVERALDEILEEQLVHIHQFIDRLFAPTVTSMEDIMCGYVTGRIVQYAFDIIAFTRTRKPTSKEFEDIGRIPSRRAVEIREQVRKALSRQKGGG